MKNEGRGIKKIPKPVYNKRFEDVPIIHKNQLLPTLTTRRQSYNQAGILTYPLFRLPSHPESPHVDSGVCSKAPLCVRGQEFTAAGPFPILTGFPLLCLATPDYVIL